jgi:hypothetical protein
MSAEAMPEELVGVLESVREGAVQSGVFGDVRLTAERLECDAANSAEPATFRIGVEDGRVWVSLVMPDRWQSESIEADLMHSGDKLEELLEEEMVDLGYEGPMPTFEHFRSPDKLFTFRTPVCDESADYAPEQAEKARLTLLGYEACFRQLGDMSESEGD